MINSTDLNQVDLSKELVLLDNVNLPFSSLLLKKGTQKTNSIITSWRYENLDNSKGLTKEGADITNFQKTNRDTTGKNVCQIIEKAVNVSGTAQSVEDENVRNIFTHEVNNRLLEAKRDLEYYLINGVYNEAETSTKPRQMKGLVNWCTKGDGNLIADTKEPDVKILNQMSKIMRQNGTASQNMVLLMDYNTYDVVGDLYADKTTYIGVTNEFGSPAKKINTKYGSCYLYLVDSMPENNMVMANMDFLKCAVLRKAQYQDLGKTGDNKKGFIVMENTLKVLNPMAVVRYNKTA